MNTTVTHLNNEGKIVYHFTKEKQHVYLQCHHKSSPIN